MSDEIEVVGTYTITEEHDSLADINSLASQQGSSVSVDELDAATRRKKHWRNLLSFWLLGLTNNFAYVVMLSAAHDILSQDFSGGGGGGGGAGDDDITPGNDTNTTNPRDCNTISTGAVLLADIVPALVMKLWAPFIFHHVHGRVSVVVMLGVCSFLLVGLATSRTMAIFGVIFAAAGSGLGEPTFLSYSANYHENVVSTWSSGTGAAGVFGAVAYAVFTSAGLTPRASVLVMLVVPVVMCVSFWLILTHPERTKCCRPCTKYGNVNEEEEERMLSPSHSSPPPITFTQKMSLLPSLMKYMIPVFLVYMAEYVINQGLLELVYFPEAKSWLDHHEQYRWYQVIYQVGVMVSRSSVNFVHVNHIWKASVLQWINVVLFLTCAIFWWIKNIWLVFFLIFWEGLLGGAAYVNTFYKLSKEISEPHKEYAMGVTTLADSMGITVAGLIAIPVHNVICSLPVTS